MTRKLNSASQNLKYWVDLLFIMTKKEIKAQYKRSKLGFLWMLIIPLLQMFIIGFIFQFFVPERVDNYFLFLLTGLLPWNFFNTSLQQTTSIFVRERTLIQKANFPREIIPLAIVLSKLIQFFVSMMLLLIAFSILGKLNFNPLFLLPVLVWLILLTSSLSLFFSALNVRFRDIDFMVRNLLPLWFYLTPIIYTFDLFFSSDFLKFLFYLNPMTGVIELTRSVMLGLDSADGNYILISLVVSIFVFILGVLTFRKEQVSFDDWL